MRKVGLALLAIAAAAPLLYAQGVPRQAALAAPQLAYAEIGDDEQLTFRGAVVKFATPSPAAELLNREIARVRASQTYAVRPAIWKIGDADTTVYLFGTVHSLPPGFRWRNPVLESVIANADSLLLETLEEEADAVTFLEGLPQGEAGIPPLLDRTTHRYRGRLAEFQANLPPEAVKHLDTMPTWIAAMGIAYMRDLLAGDMPGPGADDWLEQHFRSRSKRVEAIEDGHRVIASINALPEIAQRRMLEAALDAPTRSRAEMDGTAHAWAQGQVGPDSLLAITAQQLDPSAALADPLLVQRNAAWVEALRTLLAKRPGTVLFAAGAAHFIGDGSVLDLLRRQGLRVERVQ